MAEASPIGRGKNITLETILAFLDAIPMTSMAKNDFLAFGENRMKGWRQTHSQIARQLALYFEDANGICHPRFTSKISLQTAAEYGSRWARRYFVPNPFTPSLENFKGKETNIYAYIHQKVSKGVNSFTQISYDMFGIELNNLDKVRVYLSNFTDLIITDDEVSINSNVASNIEDVYPSVDINTMEDYFHHFDIPHEENKDSLQLITSDQPLQQIFYGAPGTGKSYTIDQMTDGGNSVRTTFHPDSDYASFVGAYKPTMKRVPMSYVSEGLAKFAKQWGDHDGTEEKIVYKFVPQAFLKAYVEAWKDLGNPHFLIIEEINRGNCAQIFGDLFQLLDRNNQGSSSYAIHADDDIRQFLSSDADGFANLSEDKKQAIRDFKLVKDNGTIDEIGTDVLAGIKLLLPPNLHIWATMNTSDQSLFPIDSAFKRRWNWEYMPIEYNKKDWYFEVAGKYYRWGDFLKAINPIVYSLTESSDKQMGFFFAKPDKKSDDSMTENNIISQKIFLNKVLFYLWSDVLKDFDPREEPFLVAGSDQQKAYAFTDFFDKTHNYLEEFVTKEKLGLKPVDIKSGDEKEPDDDGNGEQKRSFGQFLVNGKKSDTITWSVYLLVRDFAKNHTLGEVERVLNESFDRDKPVYKVIDSPINYEKENGWLKYIVKTVDESYLVISNQWKQEFIPMVEKLATATNGSFTKEQ